MLTDLRFNRGHHLHSEEMQELADEVQRLGRLTVDPPLDLRRGPTGMHLRWAGDDGSAAFWNLGAAVPPFAPVELVTWHDSDAYWDGRLPLNPGLVKVGIASSAGASAPGGAGTAYLSGTRLSAVNGLVNTGQWLTTAGGGAAYWVGVDIPTGLKVWAIPGGQVATTLANGQVQINGGLVWARFLGV